LADQSAYGGDVGNRDIQERADLVQSVRGLERDRGYAVRGAAAGVDDDPAMLRCEIGGDV
jgi:hypothetical protein